MTDIKALARSWFPGTPESVAKARAWVREAAQHSGHAPLAPTVELLVSELATNAVRYSAEGGFLIELDTDHRLIVAVCDSSSTPPAVVEAAPTDTGGRGLALVSTLADRWGVELHPDGKCLWFELAD